MENISCFMWKSTNEEFKDFIGKQNSQITVAPLIVVTLTAKDFLFPGKHLKVSIRDIFVIGQNMPAHAERCQKYPQCWFYAVLVNSWVVDEICHAAVWSLLYTCVHV